LDVWVETERDITGQLRIELAGLAEVHNLARLAWNDDVVVTRKPPEQIFGSAKVAPPSGSFLQATREGEAAWAQSELLICLVGPGHFRFRLRKTQRFTLLKATKKCF